MIFACFRRPLFDVGVVAISINFCLAGERVIKNTPGIMTIYLQCIPLQFEMEVSAEIAKFITLQCSISGRFPRKVYAREAQLS